MDLEKIYKDAGAYLEGHFLLSSGNHSQFYLQSAKVLEDPALAAKLADELARVIEKFGIKFDSVCSPALGGIQSDKASSPRTVRLPAAYKLSKTRPRFIKRSR